VASKGTPADGRSQLGRRPRQHIAAAAGDHHLVSGRSESLGDRPAHPSAAAGDDYLPHRNPPGLECHLALNDMCETITMTTPEEPRDLADEIALAWEREQPGVPVGSIGILTRIWQAAKLLTDERRRTLAGADLDAATLDLLSTLRRSGPPYRLSTRELSVRSLVTAGAVTQRVDRAQGAGLVRRIAAEPGSRAVYVQLTDAGHHTVEDAVGRLLTYEQRLVDILEPEQQEELARLLSVLLRSLARRAAGQDVGTQ
jgi:DNA-binding MarR family transcriptional regulator